MRKEVRWPLIFSLYRTKVLIQLQPSPIHVKICQRPPVSEQVTEQEESEYALGEKR